MKTIDPGIILRLSLIYQENGINISGLTNLSIKILDKNSNILLNTTPLVESLEIIGEYYYNWNTSNISVDVFAYVYYYMGTELLDIEEFYFTYTEDSDGVAS